MPPHSCLVIVIPSWFIVIIAVFLCLSSSVLGNGGRQLTATPPVQLLPFVAVCNRGGDGSYEYSHNCSISGPALVSSRGSLYVVALVGRCLEDVNRRQPCFDSYDVVVARSVDGGQTWVALKGAGTGGTGLYSGNATWVSEPVIAVNSSDGAIYVAYYVRQMRSTTKQQIGLLRVHREMEGDTNDNSFYEVEVPDSSSITGKDSNWNVILSLDTSESPFFAITWTRRSKMMITSTHSWGIQWTNPSVLQEWSCVDGGDTLITMVPSIPIVRHQQQQEIITFYSSSTSNDIGCPPQTSFFLSNNSGETWSIQSVDYSCDSCLLSPSPVSNGSLPEGSSSTSPPPDPFYPVLTTLLSKEGSENLFAFLASNKSQFLMFHSEDGGKTWKAFPLYSLSSSAIQSCTLTSKATDLYVAWAESSRQCRVFVGKSSDKGDNWVSPLEIVIPDDSTVVPHTLKMIHSDNTDLHLVWRTTPADNNNGRQLIWYTKVSFTYRPSSYGFWLWLTSILLSLFLFVGWCVLTTLGKEADTDDCSFQRL